MYGFVLEGLEIPLPHLACDVTVDDYCWHSVPSPVKGKTMIEIALQFGDLSNVTNGISYENDGLPVVSISSSSVAASSESTPGKTVRICTVGVYWDSDKVRFAELTDKVVADPNFLLLPMFLCPCTEQEKIERLLITYIGSSISADAAERAKCVSVWYELVITLDRIARNPAKHPHIRATEYYTGKLDFCIRTRYGQKLSLAQLAGEMGVTPNYLSGVYRKEKGIGFGAALLNFRMQTARSLLNGSAMSLAEIAECVGFTGETYFRRQFRRFFGVTPSEYRRIGRELTLREQKPNRDPNKRT